jgi:hypothetical protein
MKSFKTFFIRNWYWVIPLIPPLVITLDVMHFFIIIKYGGFTVSEAAQEIFSEGVIFGIVKYVLEVFFSISFFGFGFLSLIVFFLGRKFPKPLLIPVIIGGLAGIYLGWIPQVVQFFLPFYGPDPPDGGGAQSGMEMLIWPFLIMPYLFEGILAGLFISFCCGLILSLTSNLSQYHLNQRKRNWYIVSAMIILSMFIFLILPLNIKKGFTYMVKNEAKSENISQERLMEIYKKASDTKNFQLLSILARNPKTPDSILEEVYLTASESKKFRVLYELVMNPRTPGEILFKIYEFCQPFAENESSHDWRSVDVLGSLAESQNTPDSLLKELAKSNQERIRRNLAKNKNTSVEILEMLSKDPDQSVRYSMVFNPNVTDEILLRFLADSDSMIRKMAYFELKKRRYTDD